MPTPTWAGGQPQDPRELIAQSVPTAPLLRSKRHAVQTKGTVAESQYRVIAYTRVSSLEQAESRGGLDAQLSTIQDAAIQRGWTLVHVSEDAGVSGGCGWQDRPALSDAVARMERREADLLVVSRLDRLSRSVSDFSALLDRAQRKRWRIAILDAGVDTSTPVGELVANILASFAQFERKLIGQRTREAMAAKRAAGFHMGRRSTLPATTASRINDERQQGRTLQQIADGLNRDNIPTGQGGRRWYSATVNAILAKPRE
jgi:DNA invertase Pin-like site-specific DNA recombinase